MTPIPNGQCHDLAMLVGTAADFHRMRQARNRLLPQDLLGEPAWDILLALFSEQPPCLSVSAACFASGVRASTGLRWIAALEERGFVEQRQVDGENAGAFVSLTKEGSLAVEHSLRAMLRACGR